MNLREEADAKFWAEIAHLDKRQLAKLLRHTQGERDRAVEALEAASQEPQQGSVCAPTCRREITRQADDSAAYLSEPCTCGARRQPDTLGLSFDMPERMERFRKRAQHDATVLANVLDLNVWQLSQVREVIVRAMVNAMVMSTPQPQDNTSDLGLSLDMLDADRLRNIASELDDFGPDTTNWASCASASETLRTLATNIETAVRDIGVLRQHAAREQGQKGLFIAGGHRLKRQRDDMAEALAKHAAREQQLRELVEKWRMRARRPIHPSHEDALKAFYEGQNSSDLRCANDIEALLTDHPEGK